MGTVRYNKARNTWFIDYVAASGQRIRQSVGSSEQHRRLAHRILVQREAEATLGRHHMPLSRTIRFAECANDWLGRIAARVNQKTLESYEDAVAHLTAFFGEVRLGAVTRHEIETYLSHKRNTATRRGRNGQPIALSATTINYTLSVLKFILKDAVENGHLSENPAAKVKPLRTAREDGEGLHFLQPDQIERLLEETEAPYRTLYLLAVHTGLRRGELLGLRWRDIDLSLSVLRTAVIASRREAQLIEEHGYMQVGVPIQEGTSCATRDAHPAPALLKFGRAGRI